jgi:hypothetical protein
VDNELSVGRSHGAAGERAPDDDTLGTARWYPGNTWGRGFYLGLGAGVSSISNTQIGVAPHLTRSGVHVVVAPDIGYIAGAGGVDIVVNARFMVPNSAGSYLGGGPRSFQFVALSFGIAER